MVDGKKNGEFHTLDSGKTKISGSHYIYYSEYQVWLSKNDYHYRNMENGDLVDTNNNDEIRNDLKYVIESYHWSVGYKQYFKI